MQTKQTVQEQSQGFHKRYLVYWHKCANSGVWETDNIDVVNSHVELLNRQESVYTLIVYDTEKKTKTTIKEDD